MGSTCVGRNRKKVDEKNINRRSNGYQVCHEYHEQNMNAREQMVDVIREEYGLDSPKVLSVMLKVPREEFAPEKYRDISYSDSPVPIGYAQTMSQPYTVAFMTDLLLGNKEQGISDRVKGWRVLEIGTGSGYQAAILSKLVGKVYTVEIVSELAKQAEKTLKKLGYKNVYVKAGSGEWGWQEHAPYDAIIVTCGVEGKVPQELFDQLRVGGVMVVPVGPGDGKEMIRYKKLQDSPAKQDPAPRDKTPKFQEEKFGTFHFVPFVKDKS